MPLLHVKRIFLMATLLCTGISLAAPASEEEARQQRIQWWREARFGMFIHWGLYAIPGGVWKGTVRDTGYSEWVMFDEKIPTKEYETLAAKFNPTEFDAKAWASIAKKAGMRYMVFTTKHHDGFSMYDSKQADFDRYLAEFAKPQIEELLVNYKPDLMWFDDIDMKSDEQVEDLYQTIRRLRPECVLNSRIKGCRFPKKIPPPHCDYITSGDNEIFDKPIGYEWENPGSMNTSFGFNRNDHKWVDSAKIVARLVDIVSKGGNYLLNVGPTPEGLIPQPSIDHLMEVGAWMDTNGEAIYGTSPWRVFRDELTDIRFTAKGNSLYAICLTWPEAEVLLRTLGKQELADKTISNVRMLGSNEKIDWQQTGEGLKLSVPREKPGKFAFVYRIDFQQ